MFVNASSLCALNLLAENKQNKEIGKISKLSKSNSTFT